MNGLNGVDLIYVEELYRSSYVIMPVSPYQITSGRILLSLAEINSNYATKIRQVPTDHMGRAIDHMGHNSGITWVGSLN